MATGTKTRKREPEPVGTRRTLTMDGTTTRIVRIAAASRGQTIDAWIQAAIRAHALHQAQQGDTAVRAALDGRGEG